MERERKFLVKQPPSLKKFQHRRIRQGYLAIPDQRSAVEVRIRDKQGKYVLTVKGGRGASRSEIEIPISSDQFKELWRLTRGKRVEKVRFLIPMGKLVIELDAYRGKLRGLMTAEIEFKSMRELRAFKPPAWLGREVTGQEDFSNSSLASKGLPSGLRRR